MGCSQVINKPNHFINGVSSNIDLTFSDLTRETKKFNSKIPEWMNALIITALKERLILFKRYYRNHFEYNKETLLNQANVQKLS